jgi:DNA-binding LytR/AlgR family response regulator
MLVCIGLDRRLETLKYFYLLWAIDPAQFVRIHRSYVVNLEKVTKIEPYSKDNYVVVLTNGIWLPVSRSGIRACEGCLTRKQSLNRAA